MSGSQIGLDCFCSSVLPSLFSESQIPGPQLLLLSADSISFSCPGRGDAGWNRVGGYAQS